MPAWTSSTSTRRSTPTATTRSSGATCQSPERQRAGFMFTSRTATPAPRTTSNTCAPAASSSPASSRKPAASTTTATGTGRTALSNSTIELTIAGDRNYLCSRLNDNCHCERPRRRRCLNEIESFRPMHLKCCHRSMCDRAN